MDGTASALRVLYEAHGTKQGHSCFISPTMGSEKNNFDAGVNKEATKLQEGAEL
jgi:hypothetical protein